jgi:outer membrane autotransporter protein
MQLEFFNANAGKIDISVNDVTGGNSIGNYGLWIINWANPNADQTNSLNITANGHIQAYEAGILTDTNAGMLTNITIKAGAVVEATSGLAIWDEDGDTHIVVEDASEAAGSVKGRIELFTGKEVVDLHGGFSGITQFVTDGLDGDTLNVFDANSSFDADNLGRWDTINLDNTTLKLDTGTDSEVGAAADMSNGFFLKNNSVLDVSANNDFDNVGNMSIDATSAFLARADGTDGDVWITGGLHNDGLVSLSREDGTGLAGDGLRVSGVYTGNNGTVVLDTVLGDDASATDRMTFSGGTAVGTTSVVVNNAGGAGAQTVGGIKIIDVSGVSDGTFSLVGDYEIAGQQAVVAGAYGYTLWKNGVSTPTDGDWYLRSQSAAGGLIYQPGTPVFEAYPQVLLGLNGLPTLQQRVGNRMWSGNGAGVISQGADAVAEQAPVEEGASPLIEGRGIWGRIEGAHANIDPSASTTGAEYDFNALKFQAGLDIQLLENGSGVLVGGVTVHYGHASADVSSLSGDGSISTDGYGLGGTLTWYGNNGVYVDAQGQVSWYDSDLTSGQLGTLTSGNDATGYALSLETGKRIELNNGLALTPQAQLVYSSVDFDTFTQELGGQDIASVSLLDGDSLRGRLGISLDREASWQADNGLLSRSHVYGIANLHYEFLDGTAVDVSDAVFSNRSDRVWGGMGLGGSYNWNDDKYSLYGEGSVNTSLENFADSYELKGTAGLRIKW